MAINNFNVGVGTTSQLTRYRYVATGGETSVSGSDADSKTLSYTVGLEQVFLNGVNLVRGQDYTATDGTSVGSLTALVASDVVEVFAYVPFNIANALTVSTVDAKGDLLVGTGADAVGRLAVGSTADQQLVVDSSTSSGLKWGNPSGLVHISTTSFSAQSSVSLPTNTFSSTYQNYQVIYRGTMSNQDTLAMRVRAAGTDLSSSVYKSMLMWNTSASGTFQSQGSDGATSIDILGGGVQSMYYIFDINDIFEAKRTAILWRAQMMITTSDTSYNISGSAQVYNTTSYDSLTIIPAAGTLTGTLAVYGRKE